MERDAAGPGRSSVPFDSGVVPGLPGVLGGGGGRVGSQTFSIGPAAMASSGGFPASLFPADASLGSFALPGLPSMAPGGGGVASRAGFNAAMAMPGEGAPNRMMPAPSVAGPYTAPGVNPAGAAATARGGMMPQDTNSVQQAVPSTYTRMPPPPPGAPVQPPPPPPQ